MLSTFHTIEPLKDNEASSSSSSSNNSTGTSSVASTFSATTSALLSRALSLTGRRASTSGPTSTPPLPESATHRKLSAPEPSLSLSASAATGSATEAPPASTASKAAKERRLSRSAETLDALIADIDGFAMAAALEQKQKEFEERENRKLERINRRLKLEEDKERRRIHEIRERAYRSAFGSSPIPDAEIPDQGGVPMARSRSRNNNDTILSPAVINSLSSTPSLSSEPVPHQQAPQPIPYQFPSRPTSPSNSFYSRPTSPSPSMRSRPTSPSLHQEDFLLDVIKLNASSTTHATRSLPPPERTLSPSRKLGFVTNRQSVQQLKEEFKEDMDLKRSGSWSVGAMFAKKSNERTSNENRFSVARTSRPTSPTLFR